MTGISIIILLTAAVILACCFISIFNMQPTTNNVVRLAFLILATAEFAILIGPVFGVHQDGIGMAAINFGLCLLCLCDQFRHRYSFAGIRP